MDEEKNDLKHGTLHVDDVEADTAMGQHVKVDEKMSAFESIRRFPKAIACCSYMLFICIMWGYDGMAGSIVLSIPRFRQDYGYVYAGDYVVSAEWQMGFTSASLFGIIFGGFATGLIAPRVGQRACILGAYVLTIAGVFAQWFSPGDLPLFFAGKLLTGLPLGIFLTVAPIYCSEVAPPALRGAMISAVNFAIVIGQLLGYGVMRETQAIDSPMSYRIMYAVQWGFAGVGILLLPLVPESPMRLVMRGKEDEARSAIRRLEPVDTNVEEKMEEIRNVLAHNAAAAPSETSGFATLKECFNAKNRLRTTISLSVFFLQASSGVSWVVAYMGYFLQLSGMEGTSVFDATVGIAGAMAFGAIASWWAIERIGRRWTILGGLVFCTISLFIIAVLALFVNSGRQVVLTQVGFMALWAFMYQASIGSAGYSLVSEVPTSHLRGAVQSMATMVNGVSNAIWSLSLPYMINPDQANMGGKVAFIFFAILLCGDVFAYFNYPETKGRSFEEIDALFDRGVSPRHFASTKLE